MTGLQHTNSRLSKRAVDTGKGQAAESWGGQRCDRSAADKVEAQL